MTSYHLFYETSDADAPSSIKDQYGEVVLAYCKVCRKAEGDLTHFCYGEPRKKDNPAPIFDGQT